MNWNENKVTFCYHLSPLCPLFPRKASFREKTPIQQPQTKQCYTWHWGHKEKKTLPTEETHRLKQVGNYLQGTQGDGITSPSHPIWRTERDSARRCFRLA
jgi:hypothetical protein